MLRSFLRTTVPYLTLAAALLAPSVAPAQEAPVSTPAPASAAAPALPPLTLEECIALSVKKNFNLVIADYAVVMARESLIVARANFDPTLGASSSRAVSQSASTTSKLDGTTNVGPRSDTTINQLSVSQNIPQTNGTITVTTNLNRTATNSSFSTLNPAFGDQITVTASQPLLKNFGSTVARAPINNAKLNVELADLAYKISILQTVQQTEAAYYGLVYARENLRVLQHSLDLAQKLYDENLAKKNVGTATDLDVFTAEVGVQQARNNVVQAIQTVQNNEDSLLNTIGPSDFTIPVGEVSFTTIADEKFTPSFDHSYKLALDNSPNYLTQLATIEQLKITVDTTKQNRLPSLNLTGALGYNSTDATYGDVVAALPNHHGNNWSLGLVYSMPWGMRAANAQYRTAIENLNQQKTQLSQYEQSLVVSVRSAVRAVDTNAISVQISSQATQLSMKNYDLTNAQFAAGLATSRQVLQAQQDLEGVRVQELQARVNLLNAISNLRALDATSLEKYQIDLSKGRLGPVVP